MKWISSVAVMIHNFYITIKLTIKLIISFNNSKSFLLSILFKIVINY